MRRPLFICVFLQCLMLSPAISQRFSLLPARQTGIGFSNDINESGSANILAYEYFYNGGGVAAGDLDNDGLPDLIFTANAGAIKVYRNKGNFQFEDISRKSGITRRKPWATGVNLADVNGDGLLDVYICYSGNGSSASRKNELYINKGQMKFQELAASFGLDDAGCSTQAVFFDYDIDGDLDCYVLNHNIKAYRNVELEYLRDEYDSLAADRLYRNDGGRFTDVSAEAGISGNPLSFGLGIAVSDLNGDGWQDIYVSNDYAESDYCYINNANGTFSRKEKFMFTHLSQFSMGCDVADINNDGLPDLFTLDMLPADNRRQKLLQGQENYELFDQMAVNGFHFQYMRNMLHLNNGNGSFSEIGQLSGISNTDWSWCPLFADFDNDGFKDLFVTNGYMRDYTNRDFMKFWGDYLLKQAVNKDSIDYLEIIRRMPVTTFPNYIFRNGGRLQFSDESKNWGITQAGLSNGAAYADLDNDGDLDLVVNNINQPASVYRNDASGGSYLQVRLNGAAHNRFGLGTRLYCYSNGEVQLLEQMPGRGYQSCVTEVLQFGLGSREPDSLRVVWLSGLSQLLINPGKNRRIVLSEAEAAPFARSKLKSPPLFAMVPSPIPYQHEQPSYNDFKRQPLMTSMISYCSPRMAVGDLNGDGVQDLVIGSTKEQATSIFMGTKQGTYTTNTLPAGITVTDLALFDADADGDLDLYLAAGGYGDYLEGDVRLQDRLYINDSKGVFTLADKCLPSLLISKSCIAAADYDLDGDIDIFLGSHAVPGAWPNAGMSALLVNDGKGCFQADKSFRLQGLVKDAVWLDLNGDRRPELIVAEEWNALRTLVNKPAGFIETFPSNDYHGWWQTLEKVDIDGDGDEDLIAGNLGLNTQFSNADSISLRQHPVALQYADFDGNGSVDPFMSYRIGDRSYPFVSRDELLDQIYPMRRKFTSYQSYADATISDVFPPAQLDSAGKLTADYFHSAWFENRGGLLIPHPLPVEAQFSVVTRVLSMDVNNDGSRDLILLGNNDYMRLKIGKLDSNFGTLLLNDGRGGFTYVPQHRSGLMIPGDVKDAVVLGQMIFVGVNGGDLRAVRLN